MVIFEDFNSGISQSEVEVIGEVLTRIFTSKTQEHVVNPVGMGGEN